MAKKPKYYVVWEGHTPGIYTEWEAAEAQVKGYPEAVFKAFSSREEAEVAFEEGPLEYVGQRTTDNGQQTTVNSQRTTVNGQQSPDRLELLRKQAAMKACQALPTAVDAQAIAVDAACSGNPGQMEYRGVYLKTGEEIFQYGPVFGTNNIGEFLAIVHGLALLAQRGYTIPIYSDSVNAMLWVKRKQCRTTLPLTEKTQALHEQIRRAEAWLRTHSYSTDLRKWETEKWGEIPADFGRKG